MKRSSWTKLINSPERRKEMKRRTWTTYNLVNILIKSIFDIFIKPLRLLANKGMKKMTWNNREAWLLSTSARRRPSVLWISSSSSSLLSPSAPSKRRPWQCCKLLIWKWSQKVEAWQTQYCQDYICKQYFWEHRSFSWNGFDMWILKFSSCICQWNAWIKNKCAYGKAIFGH